MAYKNKEDQKAASRRHYLRNREKVIKRSAEWKKNNPESNREHSKTYYYKESEIEGVTLGTIKRRKYRAKNNYKIKCVCGSSVSKPNIARHSKTKKHKEFLNNINE